MKRRKFTPEQKSEIVLELLTNKKTAQELCTKHDIVNQLLYTWKDTFIKNAHKTFEKQAISGDEEKIHKYEQVIAKLTTQNDFLDKVLAYQR